MHDLAATIFIKATVKMEYQQPMKPQMQINIKSQYVLGACREVDTTYFWHLPLSLRPDDHVLLLLTTHHSLRQTNSSQNLRAVNRLSSTLNLYKNKLLPLIWSGGHFLSMYPTNTEIYSLRPQYQISYASLFSCTRNRSCKIILENWMLQYGNVDHQYISEKGGIPNTVS